MSGPCWVSGGAEGAEGLAPIPDGVVSLDTTIVSTAASSADPGSESSAWPDDAIEAEEAPPTHNTEDMNLGGQDASQTDITDADDEPAESRLPLWFMDMDDEAKARYSQGFASIIARHGCLDGFARDEFANENNLDPVDVETLCVALLGVPYPEGEQQSVGPVVADRFLETAQIGRGVYGSVTKAKDLDTGAFVAIKRLHHDESVWADGVPGQVLREVSVLRNLTHPNVVRLHSWIDLRPDSFCLVFELMDTDLHQVSVRYVKLNMIMPLSMVRWYIAGILAGLHACACLDIMHRDLKPQNILIGSRGEVKIADFGLSRWQSSFQMSYSTDVVTLWYRAPEILLGSSAYSFEVDVWSAGCILAELALGQPTFPGRSDIHTIFLIFEKLGTPTEETWPGVSQLEHYSEKFPRWRTCGLISSAAKRPEFEQAGGIELLRKMLECDPKKRISARRAKNNPFCLEASV